MSNNGNPSSGLIFDSGSFSKSMTTVIHKDIVISSRTYIRASNNIPLNQWVHLAFRYSNVSGSMFVTENKENNSNHFLIP
jgi:hypothetical protein